MEKRKETLSSLKLCRFCLTRSDTLGSIYDRNQTAKDSVHLPLKILTCVSIEVFPSDKMPCYICNRCRYFMNLFYDFKDIVRQSDETIMDFLQNGSHIESTPWTNSLSKAFKNSTDFGVKTIVEGGATVHVTSHDISDSDDEVANVYNVKIEDGPNADSKTTCVKVVSSKENQDAKDSTSGSKEEGGIDVIAKQQTDKDDGCWACDECDCTYPLQQLLILHKVQKHRARNVECDQCAAKFFSKYDLAAHQSRHSVALPFQCVACDKRFKRHILLKRHEKLIHSDLPQQMCPYCPASFLSIEELEAHQSRHNNVNRPYGCPICKKKFHEKASLQRHNEAVHNKILNYHCEYCPERFGSVTKLVRHVRSHAGERPYPCKHCHKSFSKSHHYTRHLRLKHRSAEAGETVRYRCEQCNATFIAQDDLIYHSAIHATQNLTCPLCQERFPDVDAVTTHIKSHVNGVEFMCDFCELVFTEKEKLDNHMVLAHEDEMQNDLEQDEPFMDVEPVDDEEGNDINLKELDDNNMVIEIKKPDNFIIKNVEEQPQDKKENIISKESEVEAINTEVAAVETVAGTEKENPVPAVAEKPIIIPAVVPPPPPPKETLPKIIPKATIVRKAEEIKRKVVIRQSTGTNLKKDKPIIRLESSSGGASDKSLRLLEKELQDLKRTNSRNETAKIPLKTVETFKSRRAQIHTSTPKQRMVEERKLPIKYSAVEKKFSEKRPLTKENKEPKEVKSSNGTAKEEKGKDIEVRDSTPKSIIKNGSNDKSSDDGVRRSTRPSKIKDYAKMIRDKPQGDSDMDDSDDDDEEYKEMESRSLESRLRARRSSIKQGPKPAPTASRSPAPRKRGRPRKDTSKETPAKVRKESIDELEDLSKDGINKTEKMEADTEEVSKAISEKISKDSPTVQNTTDKNSSASGSVLVSPTGQTLKKVPIKALPPGVKPLPLPANSRHMPTGDLCEMQIGKKVVKVQKIVMTRAEVEEMAKKGLLEMKDGTMVLKQVIKMPPGDSAPKATVAGDGGADAAKESPKKDKAVPSRCDFEEES